MADQVSLPSDLDFLADPAASPDRMNRAMRNLQARLAALETYKPNFDALFAQLQQTGLTRLNEVLQPLYQQAGNLIASLQNNGLDCGTFDPAAPGPIFQLFRSSVSGAVPSTLASGQIALNDADSKLFWLGADGHTIHSLDLLLAAFATTDSVNSTVAAAITALSLGTASQKAVGFFATAAQGAKADTALQPSNIGTSVLAPNGDGSALTGIVTVPIGATIYINGTSAPTNFLKENGALISRASAPLLWTYAQASGNLVAEASWSANRSAFSTGDLSTTFRIPDSRGLFIRGLDDGAGYDSGRGIGSYQDMSIESHFHYFNYTAGILSGGSGGNSAGGSTNAATTSYGGSETRPRNVAKLACIRYQ